MIENNTKYTLKLLNHVHQAVLLAFDYDFSLRQLAALITRQPKEIIASLEKQDGDDGISVDNFINEISKKITGMEYPLSGTPEKEKKRFFVKFNIKKVKYFELIERIKV